MKRLFLLVTAWSAASVLLLAQNPAANGNGANGGIVVVPGSSVENPGDQGHRAHTNHLIFQRAPGRQTYLAGLSPADIQTAYSLPALGGAGIIAIVDAYHYPGALSDLTTFSSRFMSGDVLNACGNNGPVKNACFWQVYADSSGNYQTSTPPAVNCGWNQEAALDIEWAHAMAPKASIVLVEANSNSFSDLFGAVAAASHIVQNFGTNQGQVSMSWGGSEFSGETASDVYFQNQSSTVFIASSGDTGGKTIYPSASPYVIAAGGTTLNMTGTSGSAVFQSETGWSGSGGGPSAYEACLPYQYGIACSAGGARGIPDFSFDADPSTGVLVYGPTCSGSNTAWMIFGGTSVSAPSLAGIINSAAVAGSGFAGDTVTELGRIYTLTNGLYRDITSGRAGRYKAGTGWDFVTGIGTPLTLDGK